ncbi:hypothetical protein LTS10_001272 [Elasticomyces elasticus]|nr:hypothetical protein LTS10_001272 [Elasticomyces elasticus]
MTAMKTDSNPPPPSYQTEATQLPVTNDPNAKDNISIKEKDAKDISEGTNDDTPESEYELLRTKHYVLPRDPPTWRQCLRQIMIYNIPNDTIYKPSSCSDHYEFVFPPCYMDIRISREHDDTSRYCIKLLGAHKGVQVEPIVVLRKVLAGRRERSDRPIRDVEASRLAEAYFEDVCRLVEKEIGVKAKFVEVAQNKICSRVAEAERLGKGYIDWHRETNACITESEGSAGVVGAEHLLRRLPEYLALIGNKQEEVPCVARLRADVQLVRRRATYMAQQQKAILNPVSKQKPVVKAATCCCTCHKATNA